MPLTNPKLWTIPLGDRADVSDLPNDPQTGANIGKASFSQLFGQINQLPLNAGGVPPSRDDFNALFKILGDNIYYLQNGGIYLWANTQTYNKYAIVMHNGVLYQSQVDSNKNQQPSSTSERWKPLIKVQTVNGQQADASGNITIKIPDISNLADRTKDNTFSENITVNKNFTVKGASTFAGASFSASPTAVTPNKTDNSTKLATTAFVNTAVREGSGAPSGSVVAFMGRTVPTGWLLCNGQNVSRTTYATLWNVLGKPNTGDKNTTFTLPNLTGRFLEGATTPLTVKNAGLPNVIVGDDNVNNFVVGGDAKTTGAFIVKNTANGYSWFQEFIRYRAKIDLSKGNAIYGKSNTVQPNSVTTLFIIKV